MTSQTEEYNNTKDKSDQIVKVWVERLSELSGKDYKSEVNVTFADSDYMVYLDGKIQHFLEVKCRRIGINDFSTTKVPLRKHATAEHFYRANGIKTYFVASFNDGTVAHLDLTEEPDEVSTQVARHDRGEDKDIYAFYKISRFKRLI